MASIGKNIKRLRMEKGITQEAFAKTINVSRQAVSSWETGRTQPDIEMLGVLSETLGVSTEELIYGESHSLETDVKTINETGENPKLLSLLYILISIINIVPVVMLLIKEANTVPIFIKYLPNLMYPVYALAFSFLFISFADKINTLKKLVISFNYALPLITLSFANKAEIFKRFGETSYHSFVAYILLAVNMALIVYTLYCGFSKKTEDVSCNPMELTLKKVLRIASVSAFYIGWISAITFTLVEKYPSISGFFSEIIDFYTGEGLLGTVFLVLPVSSVITGVLMVLFREKLTSLGKGVIFIGNIMMAVTFFAANFNNTAMIIILASDAVLIAVSSLFLFSKKDNKV